LLRNLASRPELALAVSVPYLKLAGFAVAGWLMAKSATVAAAAQKGDAEFYGAKLRTALFFAEQMLPNSLALARVVQRGAASVVETDPQLI
jgi:3-(methylthio)propanoyl-CoA dehydrogenase